MAQHRFSLAAFLGRPPRPRRDPKRLLAAVQAWALTDGALDVAPLGQRLLVTHALPAATGGALEAVAVRLAAILHDPRIGLRPTAAWAAEDGGAFMVSAQVTLGAGALQIDAVRLAAPVAEELAAASLRVGCTGVEVDAVGPVVRVFAHLVPCDDA